MLLELPLFYKERNVSGKLFQCHRGQLLEYHSHWCVKLAEILLGLVLIPVLFYTYNGVFGKSPDWINIAIYYITALLAFLFEWLAFKKDWLQCRFPRLAFAAICLIGVLFVVFTFVPPQIPLFQDPLQQITDFE